MIGPTIQEELYNLLLRFRLHRFALTADIVKMYRQVLIANSDRQFQYILWRSSPKEDLRTYQLNTVTYLAIRSLHYIADQYIDQYSIGAHAIKTSFYVDDFLGGADTLEELNILKYQVTEILKNACFELDKWHSNHDIFRNDKTLLNLNLDGSLITNALGISWDQDKDLFLFSFQPKSALTDKVTKRIILSLSSSLFDPLGLLGPLIIKAKIILQELWLLKIEWDESVPQDIHSAWQQLVSNLQLLSSIKIPRYCFTANAQFNFMDGFCDSSIRAFGCCLYLRVETASGKINSQLFTAKSRVAPTKRKSLPKLELAGAHLLALLYSKIIKILNLSVENVFL